MSLLRRRKQLQSVAAYYVPSAMAILGIVVIWHFAISLTGIKQYILPSPGSAVAALFDPKYQWVQNSLVTMAAIVGGFLLSSVVGVALGIVIVWNSVLERLVLPLLILFNTLPKVALAPLFIIWLGYGIWPNVVIATTISFFPIVLNTAAGLRSVDPDLIHLVTTLKGSRWKVFRKIRLPNALPSIFTGLKLGATSSVVGVIVGEFVASERGLGALIIAAGTTLDTPSMFASLSLIAVLGLVVYAVVTWVERVSIPWEFRQREQQ